MIFIKFYPLGLKDCYWIIPLRILGFYISCLKASIILIFPFYSTQCPKDTILNYLSSKALRAWSNALFNNSLTLNSLPSLFSRLSIKEGVATIARKVFLD